MLVNCQEFHTHTQLRDRHTRTPHTHSNKHTHQLKTQLGSSFFYSSFTNEHPTAPKSCKHTNTRTQTCTRSLTQSHARTHTHTHTYTTHTHARELPCCGGCCCCCAASAAATQLRLFNWKF